MKTYKLKNGLTIIYERKPTNSVTVEVTVRFGSNNEIKRIFGISHFIEHMLFEGTKKRSSSKIISNEIEKLGGELNAFTSFEKTAYYVKILNKHFDKALDVLSDIVQNPLFNKKSIEKERKIILKEINLVTDEPRFHQWILFNKVLFKKHPSKNPTYGTVEAVSSMKKEDLVNYYEKYYVPNNVVVTVVGNIIDPLNKIKKYFKNFKLKKLPEKRIVEEPPNKKAVKKEKKEILNSYMVLGYKTPIRLHKDSYVLDLITAVLARGQSGWLFEEIRNKRGLAYEVSLHHDPALDFGFFAVYLSTDKKKLKLAENVVIKTFKKLQKITPKQVQEAKTFIEGNYSLQNEDTRQLAETLSSWQLVEKASLAYSYVKKIKLITKKDILRVAKKYLTNAYSLAVIEQK